jgi:uncharacterized protein YlxW (UPF0749 family)|tara:strand:- start:53 stop:253 length:201 start_codon:yes stop_codon:yes gene_type:complete
MKEDYQTLLQMWREEKKKRQNAENEIENLKADLARAREDHQYDNMVHEQELESLKNPVNKLRDKGM